MVSFAEERVDDALGTQAVGFGLMLVEGWEKAVDYALYEVSHHNIGIISSDPLHIGTRVMIENKDFPPVPLIVHQVVPKKNLPPGYKRFRLIALNPDINFEKVLPESNQRKVALSTRHRYHVRFARFETDIPFLVDAKTFGANQAYTMKTINVSKSGFLLATPPGYGVPFHETTLLELTMPLEDGQTIQCLGKVIRCEVDFEKKLKRYGVNICEINQDDRDLYHSIVEDIEHRKNRQVFRQLKVSMPF